MLERSCDISMSRHHPSVRKSCLRRALPATSSRSLLPWEVSPEELPVAALGANRTMHPAGRREGFLPAQLAPLLSEHNCVPSVELEAGKEAAFDGVKGRFIT